VDERFDIIGPMEDDIDDYGEEVRRSMEGLIRRLIKVGAKIAYHGRRRNVRYHLAFPHDPSLAGGAWLCLARIAVSRRSSAFDTGNRGVVFSKGIS